MSEVTPWLFDGASIEAVVMADGTLGVSLKAMCQHLGIDARAQQQLIQRSPWSEQGACVTHAPSGGGTQETFVISCQLVPMWLAVIKVGRIKNEAARQRITKWQREAAGALYRYMTDGYAVNPNASMAQLEAMPQAVAEEVESIKLVRLQERMDYRNVIAAIHGGGGDQEDYRDVQDYIYQGLFGMTARTIRTRQDQVNGERYKIGTRKGELRPSGVAKDYLTEEQLRMLDAAVLGMTSMLDGWAVRKKITIADVREAARTATYNINRGSA